MATSGLSLEDAPLYGWSIGQQEKQQKKDQADQQKITDLLARRSAQYQKLNTLRDATGKPADGFDSAMADYQKTLGDIRDFYHPDKNPGAIAKFGHLMTDAIRLTSPDKRAQQAQAQAAQKAAEISQQAQSDVAALPPTPEQTALRQEDANSTLRLTKIHNALKTFNDANPHATDDERKDFLDNLIQTEFGFKRTNPQAEAWQEIPGRIGENPITLLFDSKSGHYVHRDGTPVNSEELSLFIRDPKVQKMSANDRLWESYASSLHKTGYDQLSQEDKAGFPAWLNSMRARSTSRQVAIPDREGIIHIIDLTSVSTPTEISSHPTAPASAPAPSPAPFAGAPPQAAPNAPVALPVALPAPGAATAPSAAPTAAPHAPAPSAPHASATHTPPTAGGGRTLSFQKTTPQYTKARNDYDDAVKLASVAHQVSEHPNDAVNQKRLAVVLERISAGRFTTQALDYVIRAGWGNTIEQWANNPTTGALPTDIVRQLVSGAEENLRASKEALDAAGSAPGQSPTDPSDPWATVPLHK